MVAAYLDLTGPQPEKPEETRWHLPPFPSLQEFICALPLLFPTDFL